MNHWIDRYGARLASGHTDAGELPLLTKDRAGLVLELARRVAHASERKNAPLAAYLAGAFVNLRVAQGVDADEALRNALAMAEDLA